MTLSITCRTWLGPGVRAFREGISESKSGAEMGVEVGGGMREPSHQGQQNAERDSVAGSALGLGEKAGVMEPKGEPGWRERSRRPAPGREGALGVSGSWLKCVPSERYFEDFWEVHRSPSNAGGVVPPLVRELRSHMPQDQKTQKT